MKRGLEYRGEEQEIKVPSITALLERVLAQAPLGQAQTNLDQADHLIELNDLESFKALLAQHSVLTEDEIVITKIEKLPPWLIEFTRIVSAMGPTDRVNYPALKRVIPAD